MKIQLYSFGLLALLFALSGQHSWDSRNSLSFYTPISSTVVDHPFLMAIEDVFFITDRGPVATGKIERGIIETGDQVEIVGLMPEGEGPLIALVRGIEIMREITERGEAGENVGLLLKGVDKSDLKRGMVIAKPGSIQSHKKILAKTILLRKEEGGRHTPIRDGYRPQFYFRTTDVTGTFRFPENIELVMPGDTVTLEVNLVTGVAMEEQLRFAVREGGRTVGTGQVVKILE